MLNEDFIQTLIDIKRDRWGRAERYHRVRVVHLIVVDFWFVSKQCFGLRNFYTRLRIVCFVGLICEHPLCLKHVQSCTELIILLYFWETAVFVVISTISNCDGGGGVGVEVLFECSDVH